MGNALKFSDKGRVVVTLSLPAPDILRCEVVDEGPGISEDDQKLLFQRFSRLGTSMSKDKGGTGLGLAICEGIVRAWNGKIGVDSRKGFGSKFWFEVPVSAVEQAGEPAGKNAPLPVIGGMRVLVVDDNDATLTFVSIALGALDIACTQARSGEEAIRIAQSERFDLIFMDIRMPGIGGIGAMQAIRQFSSAPIVAFTGEGDARRLEYLLAEGFSSVLTKPVTVQNLRDCVMEFHDKLPGDKA